MEMNAVLRERGNTQHAVQHINDKLFQVCLEDTQTGSLLGRCEALLKDRPFLLT